MTPSPWIQSVRSLPSPEGLALRRLSESFVSFAEKDKLTPFAFGDCRHGASLRRCTRESSVSRPSLGLGVCCKYQVPRHPCAWGKEYDSFADFGCVVGASIVSFEGVVGYTVAGR